MKKQTSKLLVLSALLLIVARASTVFGATWEGTDNFASGISGVNWPIIQQANVGVMTVAGANGHASFLVSSSQSTEQNAYIIWRGNPTAAEDWTAEITGHNSVPNINNGASQLQFAVLRSDRTGAGGSNQEGYKVGLDQRPVTEGGLAYFDTTQWWHGTYPLRATNSAPSVLFSLRLVYRSASKMIEAWYDPYANGLGWTMLDSISLTDFSPDMTTNNTFLFAILGNTDSGPIPEGQLWADNFRITNSLLTPPVIANQPMSRTNVVGTTATFTVGMTTTNAFSYQWRKDGTNLVNGGTISGVTTTNLTISNVQLTNAGNYTVVITNASVSVTSSVAVLTVISANHAPVAVNDTAATFQDTPVTIPFLANDYDVDGNVLTPIKAVTTNGMIGMVGLNLVYTPATNFIGTNVISYVITDGSLFATGLVTVTVSPLPYPWTPNSGCNFANIVGYYPFLGSAKNQGGSGLDGTVVGASTNVDRFGNVNSAYSFNGSNNYINCGNSLKPSFPFTFSMWVKPNSANRIMGLFSSGSYGGAASTYYGVQVVIQPPYNSVTVELGNGGYAAPSSRTDKILSNTNDCLYFGQWHHVVMVCTTINSIEFYVDGSFRQSVWGNGTGGSLAYDSASSIIGWSNAGGTANQYFDGTIDDFSIYNRSLSATEILALYNEPNPALIDSDSDGYSNWAEAQAGTSPCDGQSHPINQNSKPQIVSQPVSQAVAIGTSTNFTITASGTSPLSYQWFKDGTNLVNTGSIFGVTTTNLTVSNIQLTNAGNYTVVVTNAYGSVTSSVATLVVSSLPASPAGQVIQYDYSLAGRGTGLVTAAGQSMYFGDINYSEPYTYQILGSNSFEIINYDPNNPTNAWSHLKFTLTNQTSGLAYDLDQGNQLLGNFTLLAAIRPVLDVTQGLNGTGTLGINSQAGQLVVLQWSTNLTDWLPFSENISSSNRWEIPFSGLPPFPTGFGRAFTPTQ